MTKILRSLFAVFLFIGLITTMSGVASAETSFAVVDVQKILTESKAAQSIQRQVQAEREKLQSEFSGYEKNLRDSEEKLIAERANMDPADFQQQRDDFQKQLQETGAIVQNKKRKLEKALVTATSQLRDDVLEIVAEMSETNGIDVVMTRQNIVLVAKSLDLTNEVMDKVNAKTTSIPLQIEN